MHTFDTLSQAAALMATHGCGFIPVVAASDGSCDIEGVVTDRDIVLAAFREDTPLSAIPVTTAMSRDVTVCYVDDSVSLAEKLMCDNRVRRLPVLDFDDKLAGVISLDDIARQAQQEVRLPGLCRSARVRSRRLSPRSPAGMTENRPGKRV